MATQKLECKITTPERKKCPPKKKRGSRKLICLSRCMPIKQPCDTTARSYFSYLSDSIHFPSGAVTIRNTSKACTMLMTLTNAGCKHKTIEVGPQSSFTAIVGNLISIKIGCTGETGTGTGTGSDCTGSLELDLHYVVVY
ncbi:S-Ena type endospore appendage [Paenibacillus koleovorans]|uniref:S-Ena type endospore appendage n=1 Tax=Paenibacillus koleovorans TaxID=121608 RepID=UPI000FDC7700|nr:S-Ena type endospore appendage [Paenibacillus koleovorans]